MPELDADFIISNNNQLEAEYELGEGQHFDCSFEIFAAGTTWESITGNPYDNEALTEVLNQKADTSTVEALSDNVGTNTTDITAIQNTIDNYGNAVLYDASDFATAEQGSLADTAVQPSVLEDYATTLDLNTGLASKQDTINDLSAIRSNASNGQTAYNTIQNYGDIVTYNASNFATSTQGSLADSALQPNDNITELNNNAGFITSASLPTVNNATIKFQKNGTDLKSITLNQASNETVNFLIPTTASEVGAVPTSRTINSKSLANDISLNSADVGALASTTTINDLTTTTQQNALNSGATSTNISQITTNANNISDIQDLIPTQATTTNQLADKAFVNSSIATNTAYFIGTFQSVAELEAYSGTLTNNDYAFVETTDSAGNTLYDRYKWNGTEWLFEYELNNSSFTSNQWAAINSGANSTNIGQIATNTNDIQTINTTIGGYGDIVTHNTSEFATASQGSKADTALQPNDNISELTNNVGYITGITSSDVATALGFTPYDSANPNDYQENVIETIKVNGTSQTITSKAVDITVPTNNNQLTNGAGYITGINSSDVTAALGYTPYNDSNPAGYTTNVGTVTSVNNTQPDANGNVSLTIPTVNDGILTITQNGTSVGTFSANQLGNDTISLTDTTYTAFTGADSITGGVSGLVPAPSAGDEEKYLCGDGTFKTVSGGGTVDQTYDPTSANAQSGVAILGLLEAIYPVGSVYLSTNSTCPMASLFGTWTLVSSNRALWTGTGSNGGTTKAASLPNITGTSHVYTTSSYAPTGGFYRISSQSVVTGNSTTNYALGLDASGSSSIYSSSTTTVQPPAYVVNVWKRTA